MCATKLSIPLHRYNKNKKIKMIQNFTYILLCGIIILLARLVEVSAVREYM